jgi:glycerophosphoryl diester phosphodiesterase
MKPFEIIAHRGLTSFAPENTIEAFQLALDHGADGVEMDIRLTSDRIPVVYHYCYLTGYTDTEGIIFDFSLSDLHDVRIPYKNQPEMPTLAIPTFREVLDQFAGKFNLEIEIKGPQPYSPDIIGEMLLDYKTHWPMMEITSFEPAYLLAVQKKCKGIICNLLFPRSEPWMGIDVMQFIAVQRTRLAKAQAVHLHPSQLTEEVVDYVRKHDIEIHAWDVNSIRDLELCAQMEIPRICTDKFEQALAFHKSHFETNE